MINLLQETKESIEASGHMTQEIFFIGSPITGHRCTWAEFEILADFEYDEDYGLQNVASDLVIVFSDDTRLIRTEYDGSEAWAHVQPFYITNSVHPIKNLVHSDKAFYAKTLAELNGEV
jgi:hypothetical protein